MSQPVNFIRNNTITTGRIVPEIDKAKIKNKSQVNQPSFQDILSNEVTKNGDIKFSAHALQRMKDRNIDLTDKDLSNIKSAVSKAEDKGIKESLVVMNDISLIVNIKNKTVITAVPKENMKENVITNIDGAIFI